MSLNYLKAHQLIWLSFQCWYIYSLLRWLLCLPLLCRFLTCTILRAKTFCNERGARVVRGNRMMGTRLEVGQRQLLFYLKVFDDFINCMWRHQLHSLLPLARTGAAWGRTLRYRYKFGVLPLYDVRSNVFEPFSSHFRAFHETYSL